MAMKDYYFILFLIIIIPCCSAQKLTDPSKQSVSGIFSSTAMVADHSPRTEAGTGALMPWANRLWCITYVAHMEGTGSGTGLYEIDEDFNLKKHPESVVGTYANRLIHAPTQQLIMGPHLIDTLGNVRTIEDIKGYRLAATMDHLEDPENKVYFLAMEGDFLEVDLRTLKVNYLFDLKKELNEPKGAKPHFKSGFTNHGRVVVANNSYSKKDFNREWEAGRLAEWDGRKWTILETKPFTEVWSARAFGSPMMANGWDRSSAILKVLIDNKWSRYRLPKSSYAFDETSCTEWMRIREVETERAMMDCHGLFYEISYHTYSSMPWGIRPIAKHLRVVPDFCSWRGMLVFGGNQATPMRFSNTLDRNPLAGQPQANLWFGKTDDLWSFGKPTGMGGPWYETQVKAGEISDPYLMYGFDQKVLHLKHEEEKEITFKIEVDFVGDGTWSIYDEFKVDEKGYGHHEFPEGFNAHWVRLTSNMSAKVTAYFIYQ
ncbi:hypothetical protein [Euzebyella saccharophila]|uniref:DUF4185 domain-containing protein n=1 Tax=Euzebyella saccharophila TaxID=679664 RepID=A0ABV8JT01_9FLAO|nr:hypothetical protein [Euzebyella saccharophila]